MDLKSSIQYRSCIEPDMKLVPGSSKDYITRNGEVFTNINYGKKDEIKLFQKKTFINKHNGYLYVNINYDTGTRQRRLHRVVAETFIPNPNNYPVVMHKDNDKTNVNVGNLMWGTVSMNTKQAVDDGLLVNDKGFEDSQSIPVCVFDVQTRELIKVYGSMREARRETGISLTGIEYQCEHKVVSKPRKGLYFRYLSEYNEKGFVL